MALVPRLHTLGRADPGEGRTRTLASGPGDPEPWPERRRRLRALGAERTRRDASRRSWPWCRRRTALPRFTYRRTLAAHRGTELATTLGQLPDSPRRPRRVATRVPSARRGRAGLVRSPANLSYYRKSTRVRVV